jgi:hypothetical protein
VLTGGLNQILRIITDATNDTSYVINYWCYYNCGHDRKMCMKEIIAISIKIAEGVYGENEKHKILTWLDTFLLKDYCKIKK